MPYRKIPLAINELYHVCTKSIAGFTIFNNPREYDRMLGAMDFYSLEKPPCSYSVLKKCPTKLLEIKKSIKSSKKCVRIIAYCLMPTHVHFILEQFSQNGISNFMNLLLKSYSKYFNKKHKRKGPLWEGPFKNILIKKEDQFIHLTRYMHLNPVTAHIVDKPENWSYSSYRAYIQIVKSNLCDFSDYFDMAVVEYIEFVNNAIDYQRQLAKIKHLILE